MMKVNLQLIKMVEWEHVNPSTQENCSNTTIPMFHTIDSSNKEIVSTEIYCADCKRGLRIWRR